MTWQSKTRWLNRRGAESAARKASGEAFNAASMNIENALHASGVLWLGLILRKLD